MLNAENQMFVMIMVRIVELWIYATVLSTYHLSALLLWVHFHR